MNIRDFIRKVDSLGFKKFIYKTTNQEFNDVMGQILFNMEFDKVTAAEADGAVYFGAGKNAGIIKIFLIQDILIGDKCRDGYTELKFECQQLGKIPRKTVTILAI